MRLYFALIGVCAAILAPSLGHAQSPKPDERVWRLAQAARDTQLKLLQQIVDIDSGTGDAAGAARIDAILTPRLHALGAVTRTQAAEGQGLGDNLVATLTGTGRGRILIIAHIDTVFPAGTVASRPFRTDADKAYGPGVSDEKGGVVEAITALEIMKSLGIKDYGQITLLLETSEETGSPGTRQLIDQLVHESDVELNMEPGDAPDAITVWRKGSATIHLTVHGRAAHAGVAPQEGRNAAVELIHQLKTLDQFPQTGDGLTVNLTTLQAGSRVNVIPDLASANINYRVRTPDQFAKVQQAFDASAKQTLIPDTAVEVSTTPAFPPLPDNAATAALAARAKAIYVGLGRPLGTSGNGGASESALAAAAGTPALDGLGPVGGGFHSEREFLDLTTLTPRLYLFTELLIQLGASPPSRR
jgi:glutamate carboxypeptidase